MKGVQQVLTKFCIQPANITGRVEKQVTSRVMQRFEVFMSLLSVTALQL